MATTTAYSLRQIAELPGHEDRAWNIAWNPTRPLLASCSADKTVRLYQYTSDGIFENVSSISTGHAKTVRTVAWSPSGRTFATASFDSNIGIWQQETPFDAGEDGDGGMDVEENMEPRGEWECESSLEGHETECKCVAFSSSGTLLASCSRDKTVWIWEVKPDAEFECVGVLMSHSQDVKCVAWHPTEEILASGSYDDKIMLYVEDPMDDWYDFATLTGHEGTVWSIAFSPCGNYLASSSDDLTIRIWQRTEKTKWEYNSLLKGHDRSIYSIGWAKGESDGIGWLASAGGDGRINVWDLHKPAEEGNSPLNAVLVATVKDAHGVSDVNSVSWCPRKGFGNILATAGDDMIIRVWRMETPETEHS